MHLPTHVACLFVWIVDENYRGVSIGKQLVQSFEKDAKLKGASMIIMIAQNILLISLG